MRPNHPLSRIALQVMWDRLISVVEEQAQTLVRTAFGTPTREAGDLSAGVYDPEGRMLAQAVTGTPGHVNSMAMSVGHVLRQIPLKAKLTVGSNGIDVEYVDAPPAVNLGLNVPMCYTDAYTAFGIKCIVAPKVPNNAASLATIRTTAPEGSILNAKHPAPVAARSTIGHMLPDVMFGCLIQALPEGVPAEGTSCLWNLRLMGGPGRVELDSQQMKTATPYNVMSFHSGGTGARPRADGLSATAFPSGVKNVPVEITETLAPLVVWSKEYRTDSGGAGEYRGGLGQVMEIGSAEDMPFGISPTFDRVVFPARGRLGGRPGTEGRIELVSGKQLPPKAHSSVPAGERLRVSMPGGGGYGDPHRRPAEKVAEDVMLGLVSAAAARDVYGVALRPDGAVDAAETALLRTKVAAE